MIAQLGPAVEAMLGAPSYAREAQRVAASWESVPEVDEAVEVLRGYAAA